MKILVILRYLMVVIAIIAILASMLLPTLSQARERAKKISCTNNFKQANIGMSMYLDDNQEIYPRSTETITTGVGLTWAGRIAQEDYFSSMEILVCPSIPNRGYYLPGLQTCYKEKNFTYTSTTNLSWFNISLGLNHRFLGYIAYNEYMQWQSAGWGYTKRSKIKTPSKVIQFADSKKIEGAYESGFHMVDPIYTDSSTTVGNVWAWHLSSVTTSWVDGHVSNDQVEYSINPYLSDPFQDGKSVSSKNYFSCWR